MMEQYFVRAMDRAIIAVNVPFRIYKEEKNVPEFLRRIRPILSSVTEDYEIIFSLDGLGLLGFQAAIQRDYPVMFGTLFLFTLAGLILQIVGDLMYTIVDPRIDFEARRH